MSIISKSHKPTMNIMIIAIIIIIILLVIEKEAPPVKGVRIFLVNYI